MRDPALTGDDMEVLADRRKPVSLPEMKRFCKKEAQVQVKRSGCKNPKRQIPNAPT